MTAVRESLVGQVARQLGVVTSRRVSLCMGLWGEPGIGKSYVAQQVLARVPCRHLSLHATTPLPQLVRNLPQDLTLPDWVTTQLARIERGEALRTQTTAQTFAAVLVALAPCVLHLEDIHEAGAERLTLIQTLAQFIGATRGVGLLVTSRAELPEPFRTHRLAPLSLAETLELLGQELRSAVPQEAAAWMYGRTEGNPLFTVEYLRYLARQGFLWSDGQHWHWRSPPAGYVPVTVEALIMQLTTGPGLTAEMRATLEARAFLPRALAPELLRVVWPLLAQLGPANLDEAVSMLRLAGVLRGGDLAHPLMAEITSRHLPPGQRVEYARRAIRAFDGLDPLLAAEYVAEAALAPEDAVTRLQEAAHRLEQEGDLLRAARLMAKATEFARGEQQAALALEAARRLSGHDIQECERLARLARQSPALHFEATVQCAQALQKEGRYDEARGLLDSLPDSDKQGKAWWLANLHHLSIKGQDVEVIRLWDTGAQWQAQTPVRTLHQVASSLIRTSQFDRAELLIGRALDVQGLSVVERAELLDLRNHILFRNAQYGLVESHLTEMLSGLDEAAHPSDCATYYVNRSHARTRLGKRLEARADAEKALGLTLRTGDFSKYVHQAPALALAQIYLGEHEQAEQVLLQATTFAEQQQHPRLWDCYGHLSFLYLRWQPPHGKMLARHYARLALEAARQQGGDEALMSSLEDCCRAVQHGGTPEEHLEYALEMAQIAQRTASEADITASNAQLGRAYAALGERELALPYLRRSAALHQQHGNHAEFLIAELEIDRLENNLEAARQKLEWFEANDHPNYAARVRRHFPQLELQPMPTAQPLFPTNLRVLGPVVLERDGQEVPTRARKRLEFLALLLETRIAGHREANALELVDLLYPDMPEPEAKKALKQLAYQSRAQLGAESVVSTAGGYALGKVWSDAETFLSTGETDLWRGVYLGGLGEGWLAGVREALTLALRGSVSKLLGGDALEAARLSRMLVEMEPFDVAALHLLVTALSRSGQRSAAQVAYREGQERLQELGEALPDTLEAFLGTPVGA